MERMRKALARLGVSVLPLLLTPLWGYLIADGYLNFGGGEKDVLLLIPWLVWSTFYLVISVVCWVKRVSISRGLAYATVGAFALLTLAWLGLLVWPGALFGGS